MNQSQMASGYSSIASGGAKPDESTQPPRRYETAVEEVLEYIALNDLQPGQSLPPERHLAVAIGVRRNVLRQAFSVLEERGLIFTRMGSGRFVRELPHTHARHAPIAQLEAASIADILEARTMLEVEVVDLACQRRTLAEAEHLRQIASVLDTWEDNLRFHTTVADATHNFMLVRLVDEQARLLGDLHQRDHYDSSTTWQTMSDEHLQIAEAVMSRDEGLARELMKKHIMNTRRAVSPH